MEESLIKTYMVIKCKYKGKIETGVHSHDFYQLIYVNSGKGSVVIENEEITVLEGDVVLVPPSTKHTIFSETDGMTTYELKFDILSDELVNIAEKGSFIVFHSKNNIKNLLLSIIEELNSKGEFYKKYVEYLVSQIVILLSRSSEEDSKDAFKIHREVMLKAEENTEGLAKNIKKYLDKNFCNKISLLSLADEFSVSESHLCREFTKEFNMSPIKYVNNLRIEKAKELLENSDNSITEISEKVGFAGLHYFSRYFTKREKISPAEYRASIKGGFIIHID